MILMKLEFCNTFSKNTQIPIFIKTCPVGGLTVPCRHIHRQTKMMKLTVAFHNFAYTPKSQSFYSNPSLYK